MSRWHRLLFACSLQLERRWRGAGGCHGPSSALATAYIGRRATEPRATAPLRGALLRRRICTPLASDRATSYEYEYLYREY